MRRQFTPDMIIWSADTEKKNIEAVVKEKALPKGTIIKLDRLFFEKEQKDFINWCQLEGYPVFCDAKIIEIPDKVIGIAETYLNWAPFMLNVMANSCSTGNMTTEDEKQRDVLKRFADVCKQSNTKSCIVTVLTSKSPSVCEFEYGMTPINQVLKYVALAHSAGITDIVCSPKEAKAIREKKEFNNMTINTPGVRLPDSSRDDQQRVLTPFDALNAGANRLVIGRDLTRGDGDIVERVKRNYEKIVYNINTGS